MNRLTFGRKSGLSLFELVATLGLLSITLGISILNFRSPEVTRGPEAAAKVLVEELRVARSRAISNGLPVGFALPGSSASSQSFYLLEGDVFPRIVRAKDLRGEYSRTYISATAWPEAGKLTVEQPAISGESFVVGAWEAPFPEDPTLIFLPSGKVMSNGLPRADSRYLLLVSSGVDLRAASIEGDPKITPAAPVTKLRAASDAHTISISVDGDIELFDEIWLNRGADVASAPIPSVTAPPNLTLAPSSQPEILGIRPAGQSPESTTDEVLVPINGYLTLEIDAWSPSGVPLFLDWSGPGEFSNAEPLPMKWIPQEGLWRRRVDWHPPASGVAIGDDMDILARVADRYGNQNASLDAGKITARLGKSRGLLVFSGQGIAPHVSLDDGSSEEALTEEMLWRDAAWSPDGSQIAICSQGKLAIAIPGVGIVSTVVEEASSVIKPKWSPDGTKLLYATGTELVVISPDGSDRRSILDSGSQQTYGGFSWSPNGKKVAYGARLSNLETRINIVGADGTGHEQLSGRGVWPTWSPDGTKLAFFENGNSTRAITFVDANNPTGPRDRRGLPFTNIGYSYGAGTNMSWSPDSAMVSFSMVSNQVPGSGLHVVNADNGQFTHLPLSRAIGYDHGVWAPDENKLLYTKNELTEGMNSSGGISSYYVPSGELQSFDLATGIDSLVISTGDTSLNSVDWTR